MELGIMTLGLAALSVFFFFDAMKARQEKKELFHRAQNDFKTCRYHAARIRVNRYATCQNSQDRETDKRINWESRTSILDATQSWCD